MGKEMIRNGVDLDRETDGLLTQWARQEERSKRLQTRVIVRRVVRAWKERPEVLKPLGLVTSPEMQ